MTTTFLDVTRLVTRLHDGLLPTGVDRVGLAYIQHYRTHARAVLSERGFSVILTEHDSQSLFERLLAPASQPGSIRTAVVRAVANGLINRPPRGSVLLHTSHSGMEFPRYYRSMKRRGARTVFLVHDLIPLTHAEYCRPGIADTHRRRMHTVFRHADGLIANSYDTLHAMQREAETAGLTLPPSVVAHLAPGVIDAPASAPLIDAPYFVMLGTIEPRKNHWFMLHVWRQLAEHLGAATPRLVIIGRRGWECENVVDMLERCESLRGLVIEEANCPDARLHAWLQHARALLFPSFVEGYGIPLVEALAAGIPVIASNLTVFDEIAVNMADHLDPLDGPGWRARILAYAAPDSVERNRQLARVAAFRRPTWDDHFSRLDPFLDSLN